MSQLWTQLHCHSLSINSPRCLSTLNLSNSFHLTVLVGITWFQEHKIPSTLEFGTETFYSIIVEYLGEDASEFSYDGKTQNSFLFYIDPCQERGCSLTEHHFMKLMSSKASERHFVTIKETTVVWVGKWLTSNPLFLVPYKHGLVKWVC